MEEKKILFISDQIAPFVGQSFMSEYCKMLPPSILELGHEIRTFMPKWGQINERRNQLHEVIRLSGMNLIIDDTDHPLIIKVASLQSARIQIYFIDNEDFFQNRLMVTDKNGVEYADNDERCIFFARGVLETVKKLRWTPDVIHCHGWLPSLVPLFVKTAYHDEPAFRESKIVYSLYDKAFEGTLKESFPDIILTKDMTSESIGEFSRPIDYNSLMKKAIDFSDGVVCNVPSVDPVLREYAVSRNLPVLDWNATEESVLPADVNELYKQL